MANDNMPFVGIIGGFLKLAGADAVDARQTAQEIGAALATAGMGLVVYFSDDASLEPHVVSGYVKALPPGVGAGSIRMRFAESQRGQVKFPEQTTRGELFEAILFPGKEWEAPFYRSLFDADGGDAVLLLAGGRWRLIGGQIALGRPLPALAGDECPGAAVAIRRGRQTASKDSAHPTT